MININKNDYIIATPTLGEQFVRRVATRRDITTSQLSKVVVNKNLEEMHGFYETDEKFFSSLCSVKTSSPEKLNEKDGPEVSKTLENQALKKKADEDAGKLCIHLPDNNPRRILDVLYGKTSEERKALFEAYETKTGNDLKSDLKHYMSGSDRELALSYLRNGKETDAEKLHRAMAGIGTDERAIFRVLEGKTGEERKGIEREYKSKFGKELMAEFEKEMSGRDLAMARHLLEKGKLDTYGKLDMALSGLFIDKNSIFETLQNANPEERKQLQNDENIGERLRNKLRGKDEAIALALLNSKDGKLTTFDRLNIAMSGLKTDEELIFKSLEKAGPEDRKNVGEDPEMMKKLAGCLNKEEMEMAKTILKDGKLPVDVKLDYAMKGMFPDKDAIMEVIGETSGEDRNAIINNKELMGKLEKKLGDKEFRKADLLLKQGNLTPEQKIDFALQGWKADANSVYEALSSASPEERKKLQDDPVFMKKLNNVLSGKKLERAKILLDKGHTDPADEINIALKGFNVYESDIFSAIKQCKTDEEKQNLKSEYQKRYGSDLLDTLKTKLGKNDFNTARELLRPEPATHEEQLERLEEKVSKEREGRGLWHGISNYIVDRFSDAGRNLDDASRELRYSRSKKIDNDSVIKAEKRLNEAIGDLNDTRNSIAYKANIASSVGVSLTTAAVTGGASLPVLLAFTTATTAKLAVNKAVKGDNYDLFGRDGLKDIAQGSVEKLVSTVVPGSELVGSLMQGGGTPILSNALAKGITQGITSAAGSGFSTAINKNTWKEGVGQGFSRVTTNSIVSGTVGLTVGNVFELGNESVSQVIGKSVSDSVTTKTVGIIKDGLITKPKDDVTGLFKQQFTSIAEEIKGEKKDNIDI